MYLSIPSLLEDCCAVLSSKPKVVYSQYRAVYGFYYGHLLLQIPLVISSGYRFCIGKMGSTMCGAHHNLHRQSKPVSSSFPIATCCHSVCSAGLLRSGPPLPWPLLTSSCLFTIYSSPSWSSCMSTSVSKMENGAHHIDESMPSSCLALLATV
jgi:hypothetical protein